VVVKTENVVCKYCNPPFEHTSSEHEWEYYIRGKNFNIVGELNNKTEVHKNPTKRIRRKSA